MGDAMKDFVLFSFLFLAVFLMNCAKEETIQQESPIYQKAELILEIDASYDYENYDGHRFVCPIKRVIKGTCEEKFISLKISLSPEKKETYAGYLKPYGEYESLVVGFTHLPEAPANLSGFRDAKNRYWEILFVAKMAILEKD